MIWNGTNYIAIHFLVALIPEAVIIRAMCKVLDMRSNWLYVVCHLSLYCLAFALRYVSIAPLFTGFLISIMIDIVLPFVMSRGHVRTRLSRITFVNVGAMMTEFVGASTYHLISGGEFFPSEINQDTILAVTVVYSLLALVAAIILEVVIVLCARIDRERDTMLELPVIGLLLFMFFGLDTLIVRLDAAHMYSLAGPFFCMLCCLSSLGVGLGLLAVARLDVEARRAEADRVAMTRQERHVRSEVEASVRRTMSMSRLRHDLSNQIEVVERLAASGKYAEADYYLAALQVQSRSLIGEDHE